MEPRTMPRATFRDETTGEQVTVELTLYERRLEREDRCVPHPTRDGRRLTLIQVQT